MTDDVLHVRHVLARWRANDWRHAFTLADGLDGSLRDACDVPSHEPLTDNSGALAAPMLRRLGEFDLEQLVPALRPLLEQLARPQTDLPPGLAELGDCALLPIADVIQVVSALDEAQARAVVAAERALVDVQASRSADLTDLQAWNEHVEQIDDVTALRTASLAAEAQALLDASVDKGDAGALQAVQQLLTAQEDPRC
ncbi:MAG: hypothetical protein H7233_01570 [Pseudorhodobacter sp.]|nr:hypothetical protein [Frankiaceae bacterium]